MGGPSGFRVLFLAVAMASCGLPLAAREPVDRLVAVVDDDPIFFSDLRRAVQLGLVKATDPADPWREVLDRLIEQRLRAHEIDRYGIPPARDEAVAQQVERLEAGLGGEEALDAELRRLDATRAELDRAVALQLRVLGYVEERLAPRVLIDDEAINLYYQNDLRAELTARGEALPPLTSVRGPIHDVLRERQLNREVATWTAELKKKARIQDVLASATGPTETLPPVVLELGLQPGGAAGATAGAGAGIGAAGGDG